jgi:hypothetical protein
MRVKLILCGIELATHILLKKCIFVSEFGQRTEDMGIT